MWSVDGQQIFYRNATAMFAVTLVKTASAFDASPPQQLFPISDPQLLNSYALAPDGQRFLFVRLPGNDRVSIFLNWAAHLDELTRSQ